MNTFVRFSHLYEALTLASRVVSAGVIQMFIYMLIYFFVIGKYFGSYFSFGMMLYCSHCIKLILKGTSRRLLLLCFPEWELSVASWAHA